MCCKVLQPLPFTSCPRSQKEAGVSTCTHLQTIVPAARGVGRRWAMQKRHTQAQNYGSKNSAYVVYLMLLINGCHCEICI